MSGALSIVDSEGFDKIKQISDLYVKGVTSPYTIARRLGMKVVEVRSGLETWKQILRDDAESKDLAVEALDVFNQRTDELLESARTNLENLEAENFNEKISAQINTTIRTIADLDSKRVDFLQKSGLLSGGDLGDEIVEYERREQIILKILREDLCPTCQQVVRDKITALTGTIEGTVVESETE